ncbi:MAG: helix-turn-helix domain-containing protein [Oligoflexales bacterium]
MNQKPSTESVRVKNALKQLLKKKGYQYQDLAKLWGLSESSVKRLLTYDDLSLERIVQACSWLEVSFHDLVQISDKVRSAPVELSHDQEGFLAKYPHYMHYFWLLSSGFSPKDIQTRAKISKKSGDKYLDTLQEMGLVDLQNNGKVKVLVKGGISWRLRGPLLQGYLDSIIELFVNHLKDQVETVKSRNETRDFTFLITQHYLTRQNYLEMLSDLRAVIRKFGERAALDHLTHETRDLECATVLLGVDRFDPLTAAFGSIKSI